MAKIDSDLHRSLKEHPDKSIRLIVRTKGDISEYEAQIKQLGLRVTRRFKLIQGAAVSGKGRYALDLLGQSWVQSIEADKPVRTAR
jgi:hypothetical protein